MDALRTAIEVLFLDWNFDDAVSFILDGTSLLNDDKFENLFTRRNGMFGTNVVSLIPEYLESTAAGGFEGRSPYNLINYAASKMVTMQDDEPICLYDSYLRWNEVTASVGEDLLTTMFLVSQDFIQRNRRKSFAWKPVLRADSDGVNSILEKGLSELHFHLKGSSSVFDLNWLVLMNVPVRKNSEEMLTKMSVDERLYPMLVKAALIRWTLFAIVNGLDISFDGNKQLLDNVLREDSDNIDIWSADVQKLVSLARLFYGYSNEDGLVIDYAIPTLISALDIGRKENVIFIGERKLLYDCFWHIREHKLEYEKLSRLLYAYLLAKNKFRHAVVQNDSIKGFSNFQEYDKRKNCLFSSQEPYKKLVSKSAVHCSIDNQPIADLEMRITPDKKSSQLQKNVKKLNAEIGKVREDVHIGYILHFIKGKDSIKANDDGVEGMSSCRNANVRKNVAKQADAICSMIKYGSRHIKSRPAEKFQIVGIDAAGSEFNCRAEIFAESYRKIKAASREHWIDILSDKVQRQLGRTFHVGEDFYDIVDGLRAVEESLLFLNLGRGDRIGHGVALGIDAFKYYSERHYTLIINRQCLLDNVAWMLTKMDQYSLSDTSGLKARLQNVYNRLIKDVYQASAAYQDYYSSWLLRGDRPSLVFSGERDDITPFGYNDSTEEIINAHHNAVARDLYIKYHYNAAVMKSGGEVEEYKVLPSDVKIVEQLQDIMLKAVLGKEIAIETNPTSNLRITDVRRYAEHPILKFNSRELGKESPELSVSINTDDQGIFGTSLEKEYTLMALALEKEKNEDGEPIYKKQDVLRWLECVRKMGYERSFLRE